MKSFLAIFLMICLQVAMSPYCLCFGAEVAPEVAPATCCHAPEGSDPGPCPHCDQELPIAVTAPVKGDFSPDAPEWTGFALFFAVELFDVLKPISPESQIDWALSQPDPPPLPFQAVYGVFLI